MFCPWLELKGACKSWLGTLIRLEISVGAAFRGWKQVQYESYVLWNWQSESMGPGGHRDEGHEGPQHVGQEHHQVDFLGE